MAEKKVISDFNMAAEIRKLLREKRSMMGREVYDPTRIRRNWI